MRYFCAKITNIRKVLKAALHMLMPASFINQLNTKIPVKNNKFCRMAIYKFKFQDKQGKE